MTTKKGTTGGPSASGLDLKSISTADSAETGVWFTPLGPDGRSLEEHGVRLKVLGEDSKRYEKALNKINDMRAAYSRGRRARSSETLSAEELRFAQLTFAVHLTVEWERVVYDGVERPCDDESKRLVFSDLYWLAEQVIEFARERANFMPT